MKKSFFGLILALNFFYKVETVISNKKFHFNITISASLIYQKIFRTTTPHQVLLFGKKAV